MSFFHQEEDKVPQQTPAPAPLHQFDHRSLPPVVTIFALAGIDVDTIAPQVAEQLGVAVVEDRIPDDLAARAGLPPELVEKAARRRRPWRRFPAHLLNPPTDPTGPAAGGVVVGAAAALLFRAVPGVLHVHLGGPQQRRIQRMMDREQLDHRTAERRIRRADQRQARHLRSILKGSVQESELYHLMLDATGYSVDTCVDLIVTGSNRRTGVTDLAPAY
jgi:cytidylate kinase